MAAIVGAGGTVNAGYLTSTGSRSAVTDIAEAQLRAIAPDRTPVTRELDGLAATGWWPRRRSTATTSSLPAYRCPTSTPP
ncbi:putative sensor histidine kinase TcrY domain protein [Mycobacterium xenopi 4042]|uniref:Putative sensor histidine kinase TcrY domain protein n=1 Tax=Mycobacterium xenopi 4042 TaxID=1299334 RepID=X7ZKH0_MYCXE|nr:putative sensor histidine kinase TcrY domain protein [Mycobacterium xenopi 4042]